MYAVEHRDTPFDQDPLHLWLVQSTVARGRITHIDPAAALAHTGVVAVVDHTNAPRLVAEDDSGEKSDRELTASSGSRDCWLSTPSGASSTR
jgi:CO/xanthine dehydrogenase Mo-binding subunit